MIELRSLKKKAKTTASIKPGTYLAEVTEVADDTKYVDGAAFIVKYKLLSTEGQLVGDFRETFYNSMSNSRTAALAEFMDELGVKTVDELVGVTMRIEIRYRVTNYGKSLPSIVSRTPIPSSPGDPAQEAT